MAEVTDISVARRRQAAKKQIKRNATVRMPEQRLILAVILQAVDELPCAEGRCDAERYFRDGGFVTQADAVDLDPEFVLDVLTMTRLIGPAAGSKAAA